jgi:hypothetical protein
VANVKRNMKKIRGRNMEKKKREKRKIEELRR